MNESPMTAQPSRLRPVLKQLAFVLLLGVAISAVANALSPRGLSLGHDYFPPAAISSLPATPIDSPGSAIPVSKPKHEFDRADRADVEAFIRDNRFVTGKFVLIDARSVANYQAGHIAGALQYDHFRPQENLAQIVPACLNAEKIIIYCHGGSCDDSIFTARLIAGYGVPATSIAIYENGIEDWRAANLPVKGP